MSLLDLIQPRIAELGKIKIGGKSEQERTSAKGVKWRAPEKHDHFTVVTLHRNARGDLVPDDTLMKKLVKDYGDSDGKLRQLPVAVLSNEIEDILQASFVYYIGKKVAARSDGKTLTVFYDSKAKSWLKDPQEREWDERLAKPDDQGNCAFKLHTIFSCVVASENAKWGGLYKFRTTSRITASQLLGSLMHLKELTGGILRGLPLRLAVRPMQVSPGGRTTTVYVVHVELVGRDLQAIQGMALQRLEYEVKNAKQMEAARLEYRRLLLPPGSDHESPAEVADVSEEFHPEMQDAEPPAIDPLAATLGLTGQQEHPAQTNGEQSHDDLPGDDDLPNDDDPQPDLSDLEAQDLAATIDQGIREATCHDDLKHPNDLLMANKAVLGERFAGLKSKMGDRLNQFHRDPPKRNGGRKKETTMFSQNAGPYGQA